ncbi:hypothetical protein D3C87_450640 [compost metagenome]
MPTAAAITHRVNSSREPVRATCHKIHGNSLRPTTSMKTMKPATCPRVTARVCHRLTASAPGATLPPSAPANAGSSTSTSTVTRSSTTSQPTAMRPLRESRMPRSSRARSSTTVLATDRARPKISPPPRVQPHQWARPMPIAVATPICRMAPGSAILRTSHKSSMEKCRPTPNIISITPISANCPAISASATKPGVAGPMMMPAAR